MLYTIRSFVVIILMFVFTNSLKARFACKELIFIHNSDTLVALIETTTELDLNDITRPSPLFKRFHTKQSKNKKITATLLAFPFPFGIVGLHRIYLGTAPYVPVVYIASLGGAFGVLPLVDFFVLLLDKNIDRFADNNKVFMWVE